MSQLVTGEAVALELMPAKLPSRALAAAIDAVAVFIVYLIVSLVLVTSTASLDGAAQAAVSVAAFVLVLVGGPIAVETLSHGRSLGKLAFGLRVVRDDGGPIRFRHALVRGAIGMIEILTTLGVVACVASLVSERGRRLGDVFAGTLVVRERVPTAGIGFLPPPPPGPAGPLSGVDLSAVPDGLWLAVRQYLTRMHQLDPQVSMTMADNLAAELAARTVVTAPPGMHATAYLAAMLYERQSREARKAFAGGAAEGVAAVSAGASKASAGVPSGTGSPAPTESPAPTGFPPPAERRPPVGFQPPDTFQPSPAFQPPGGAQSSAAPVPPSSAASSSVPAPDVPAARPSGRTSGFVPPA